MPLADEPKGLGSLPNEILLEIFLEKVLTETDLFSLALVSRRFSHLVPVSLYDSISCRIDHDKLKSEAMSTSTIKESGNLLRNFCARPDLGSLVRVAILYLAPRLYDKLIIFLKCVPELRSLSLRQSTPKWERIPKLLDVPMLSLRNAPLEFNLNAEDLGKFMLLPNIRTLRGAIQTRPADPVIDFAGQAGKSSLKFLKLHCKSPNMPSRELLALPEALLEFDCDTDPYTNAQPRVPLSPKTMSLALMPSSSTLQSLVLIGYEGYDGEEIETDGSLIDFSCFTSLRSSIIIHVYCFLSGNDTQFSERRGFYRKLPPALEELRASEPLSLFGKSRVSV